MKIKKIDITDIDGFRIGNAEDPEGGTGCTVIICEEGAVAGVDVRGGGPATRETDLLKSENTVQTINAVVLSGGSAFGLEAASGVMRSLATRNIGFNVGDITVPIVAGASLFDLAVGRSDVFPDREMGMAAVDNAYFGTFESGNHGAGTGATCGKILGMDRAMKTGLGTFACGDGIVDVGAIAAVNACADIYNGAGNIIAGLRTSDGTAIKGTIKVLKEMLHPEPENEKEIKFEDLKPKETFDSVIPEPVKAPVPTEVKTEEPLPQPKQTSEIQETNEKKPDFKSDIARAIQEAYEAAALKEQAITEEVPLVNESVEPEPAEEPVPIDASQAAPEEEPVSEVLQPSTEPEPAPVIEQPQEIQEDPAAEEQTVQTEEPEETEEPEKPEEPDPFELSEEEKADMGYDIPFNTTIGCLITNARLSKSQANKLASILHDAYARAIKPVHSTLDGDTIFVMSTCKQDVNFDAFAALATDVMQYAIIDGANQAEGAYGLPAARDMIEK